MKIKITKTAVDKITTAKDKPIFYYDTDLIGFGIKASTKRIVYFAEDQIKGKTIRKNIGLVGTLTPEQARKEAKSMLGKMALGVNVNAEDKKQRKQSITLVEAYEAYKDSRHLGDKTKYDYDRAIETTFKDWKDKTVVSIKRDMIENKFKETTKQSPSLANLHFRLLRSLLNFAMEEYSTDGEPLIPSNPCNRLKALKLWNRIARKDTFISPSQLKDFFKGLQITGTDNTRKVQVKQQIILLLFTGCREQEIAKLKRKDIDFTKKTITFMITKNHHKHVLPIGNWLEKFLTGICKDLKADDYLFPAKNKTGHILDQRRVVKKIAEDCGVDFTLHDIRRTFASIVDHNLNQSFSAYTIKRLLNHAQATDVTAGYIKFGVDDLIKPMQLVEDFILEQAGIDKDNTVT